jgi:hypothetical protein
VMPAQRELGARVEFAETVLHEARKIGPQQCLVLARTMGSAAVIALPECGKMFSNLEHRHSGRIPAKATRNRGPEPAPWIPAFARGCPGNGNGLLCLDRNQLKVPLPASPVSVASTWMAGSSQIKSDHVVQGSLRFRIRAHGKFRGRPCAFAGMTVELDSAI